MALVGKSFEEHSHVKLVEALTGLLDSLADKGLQVDPETSA